VKGNSLSLEKFQRSTPQKRVAPGALRAQHPTPSAQRPTSKEERDKIPSPQASGKTPTQQKAQKRIQSARRSTRKPRGGQLKEAKERKKTKKNFLRCVKPDVDGGDRQSVTKL
jgi:hypothetical protein